MSPRIDFIETERGWRRALPARDLAREAVAVAAAEAGVELRRGAELSLHLVGDAEIQALNATWRGKDAPTNVLSFPVVKASALGDARLLGDVFVSLPTLKREAEAEGKALADHYRHLVIHGFLHLVGFDHETESEAEAMEEVERRALAKLGVSDPYAGAELASAS